MRSHSISVGEKLFYLDAPRIQCNLQIYNVHKFIENFIFILNSLDNNEDLISLGEDSTKIPDFSYSCKKKEKTFEFEWSCSDTQRKIIFEEKYHHIKFFIEELIKCSHPDLQIQITEGFSSKFEKDIIGVIPPSDDHFPDLFLYNNGNIFELKAIFFCELPLSKSALITLINNSTSEFLFFKNINTVYFSGNKRMNPMKPSDCNIILEIKKYFRFLFLFRRSNTISSIYYLSAFNKEFTTNVLDNVINNINSTLKKNGKTIKITKEQVVSIYKIIQNFNCGLEGIVLNDPPGNNFFKKIIK